MSDSRFSTCKHVKNLQSDLRHSRGRTPGGVKMGGSRSVSLETIPYAEGGWVKLTDFLSSEALWTDASR